MDNACQLAVAIITQFEGFSNEVYKDPTGTLTIGYGTTFINNKPLSLLQPPITKDQALSLLTGDVAKLEARLGSILFEPLSNHQMAAVLSLCYNIGFGAFQHSTLLVNLNDGAYGAAAAQFLSWTHSKGITLPGLSKRRDLEVKCFNTPD